MEHGWLPEETKEALHGIDLTGFSDNYWVGLSVMHNLFAREHNAICDMLKAHHPTWSDEELFLKARLINAALIAKSHTIEWTPGSSTIRPCTSRAITLHNHPNALRDLTRVNGDHVDIATIDVLRDRERGVPRDNAFREKVRKKRVEKFEDLTPNAEWNEQIREVCGGNIDKVDTQVGLLGEKLPPGFGFSDTAFRIFILIASRRLKSDRFFTSDYTPEVYTPEGIGRCPAASSPRAHSRARGIEERVRPMEGGR